MQAQTHPMIVGPVTARIRNPLALIGSEVGFEVTNNRYCIPGGTPGCFDATSFLTFGSKSHPGTIELAIANSFFTSGPFASVGVLGVAMRRRKAA